MATENPQALNGRSLSIFLWGEHYDMKLFSLKQNVEDIFIDGHRRKERQKQSYFSKF